MDENNINKTKNPRKRDFRCKAYANGSKSNYSDLPINPESINWKDYFDNGIPPTMIDIGCGYGRFLFKAAQLYTEENFLGIELREIVCDYVKQKIENLELKNCAVLKYNGLLFLPNILKPESIRIFYILYPDPRHQKSLRKTRIVNKRLFNSLEYLLIKNEGKIYFSTDLKYYYEEIKMEIEEYNKISNPTNEKDTNNYYFKLIEERKCNLTSEILKDNGPLIDKNKEISMDGREDELKENCYKNTNEARRMGVKSGEAFFCVYLLTNKR